MSKFLLDFTKDSQQKVIKYLYNCIRKKHIYVKTVIGIIDTGIVVIAIGFISDRDSTVSWFMSTIHVSATRFLLDIGATDTEIMSDAVATSSSVGVCS